MWLQLSQIICQCQQKRQLINILFGKMTEAEQMLAAAPAGDIQGMWQPVPKNLMRLPDSFVLGWLMDHSDLIAEHLLATQRHDPKGAQDSFVQGTVARDPEVAG